MLVGLLVGLIVLEVVGLLVVVVVEMLMLVIVVVGLVIFEARDADILKKLADI